MQQPYQGCKGNFGSVGLYEKHGFAEKGPAQGNTVKPPSQFSIHPGFHGMGESSMMQGDIRLHHFFQNPCPIPLWARH